MFLRSSQDDIGKNPVVVDPKCDVKLAARRILWGRFSNAGQVRLLLCVMFQYTHMLVQTCLAPEYVLVPKTFQDKFVEALVEASVPLSPVKPSGPLTLLHLSYHAFYPEGPAKSNSFSRIVSEKHTARIKQMIDGTKGTIVVGGDADVSKRYIAPTIVKDVRGDDSLMAE